MIKKVNMSTSVTFSHLINTMEEFFGEQAKAEDFCKGDAARLRAFANTISQLILDSCEKCGGTGEISYYHDAGDHFGAGAAPGSGMKTERCSCQE